MNQRSIHIQKDEDPMEKLMPMLEGKVFHVSLTSNWAKIHKSREIVPNNENSLETTFGCSSNSYFKNNGCVSVFDYRRPLDEKLQKQIDKCQPIRPLREGKAITIFILKSEAHDHLRTWEDIRTNIGDQLVVPYIEAGYPDKISLSLIEEFIFVTMDIDNNSLSSVIRKAHEIKKRD